MRDCKSEEKTHRIYMRGEPNRLRRDLDETLGLILASR